MDEVEQIILESAQRQREAVDLLLWSKEQSDRAERGEPACIGGSPGAGSHLDPHRVLEIGPEGDELALHFVTQRRVNNRWKIDEAASTKVYLNPDQIDDLRDYLNRLAKGTTA